MRPCSAATSVSATTCQRQIARATKEVVRLISEGTRDPAELTKVIHGRTVNRVGKDVILASLTGVISNTDIDVIRQLREEVALAEKHKDECQSKMDAICQQYFPEQLKNLQTIPGIKGRSATAIIAEVGTDMSSFEDAAHLVSWCGLKPRNEESAGKIKAREHHTWKQILEENSHRMRLGRIQDARMLLQ